MKLVKLYADEYWPFMVMDDAGDTPPLSWQNKPVEISDELYDRYKRVMEQFEKLMKELAAIPPAP